MRTQAANQEKSTENKYERSGNQANLENHELPGTKTYEPKCIRGPTAYKTGSFRTLKTVGKSQEESMDAVAMKPDEGMRPQVKLRQQAESENADFLVGKAPDESHILFSGHKHSQTENVNTSKDKRVDLVRAKGLHGKAYTTYSESIKDAFCHVLPKGASSEHFMRYLEDAAADLETADIAEVFPFLASAQDHQKLNKLLDLKNALQSNSNLEGHAVQEQVNETNRSIELLRAKIYEDRLKKIQFKKRLELLLETSEPEQQADEEFWLWVLLKKLLKAIEETLETSEEAIGKGKPTL